MIMAGIAGLPHYGVKGRMDISQIIINGVVLGALYACIAASFSLVWGVLNVINIALLFWVVI